MKQTFRTPHSLAASRTLRPLRHFVAALTVTLGGAMLAPQAQAAPSILDIKHSIQDDNIVPPESFETKARELEENFYLSHYATGESSDNQPQKLGTPAEYEKRLAKLPTDIEMPYNSVVGKYIDMYVGKRRGMVSDLLALHSYYGNIFLEELEKEGLPTELQYLPVIESALKPNAVSRAGATGLWQFMPATAKGLGMEISTLVDERRDPRAASRAAARYLKQLYNIYDDWSLAIAAYNCGPGNVNKALRRAGGGKKDFWEIYRFLPAETRGYVPAFIAANYAMNYYKEHNIQPRVISRHLVTDTVMVDKRVHLNQIADVLNIPVEEIRMLNPMFRKDIIPGDIKPYPLVLPSQQVLSYVMSEPQILAHEQDIYRKRTYVEPRTAEDGEDFDGEGLDIWDPGAIQPEMAQSLNASADLAIQQNVYEQRVKKTHTVARGENLRDIARRYGVSATDIKRWNNLRRGKVKEGDKLVIETYEATGPALTPAPSTLIADNGHAAVPQRQRPVREESAVPPPPSRPGRDAQTRPAVPQRRDGSEVDPVPAASKKKERLEREAREDAAPAAPTPKKKASAADKKKVSDKKKAAAASDENANAKKSSKTNSKTKAKAKSYTVKSGDNLYRIAKNNGTTVDALRKANGIKGDNLRAGQKIKIP